jgi:uncharacterized protein (TIGR00251 family)
MNLITIDIKKIVRSHKKGVEINFQVLPRSSQSKIVGLHNDAVKIKLNKPPVDGQANAGCCRVVAKYFKVSKTQVSVLRGTTSRQKTLLVEGVSALAVIERLEILKAANG